MSEDGDPIDWTVDEVVSFLCHNPQTPWSSSTVPNRPDPVSLEASLRENLITGEVLLHDIDLKNLHEDLGIKAFGHRSSVFRAIQYLRKRSLKYQITQEEPNRPHDGSPLSTSRVGTPQREHLASPHIRIPSTAGPNALKGKRPVEYPLQERTENSRPDEDADSNSENHKATGKPFENRPQESIIVDGQGRKRRRLELLPQVQESGDKKIVSKSTDGAQPKEWYMGLEKFQTAQLFYPNTEEDDQSFVMLGPKFPTAQRSFVNKSLNYFYKQQPIKLHSENGKDQWALMPYRTSDDDKERYFTLYTSKNGRVTVSQQNMNKWPQFSKSQAPVEALGSSDPFAYLIQKYPAVEDSADEIYPLYGESGSEGEYDESTWEEIDDEQQDPGYGKPTKLSRAQVETVMNDCVVEYQKKWHEDKQPKEEQGARKLWLKAKRSRSTNTQIKLFMHEIQLQERRLRKVQDTIRGNDYFAKSELNLICQSMESPIFKIMKEKWRISVLEREECPPRIASTPEPRPKPKSRPTNDDEESLSSDSDESRDDDFINDSDVEVEVGSNHDFSTTRSPSNVSEDDIVSPYREKQKLRTKRPNPLSLRSPSPEGFNNEPSSPDGPTNEPNMDLIDLTMDTPPPDDLTIETPPLNPVPPKNLQHSSTKVPKSEMSSVSPGPELGSRISVEIPKPKQEHIKSANHDLPRINDFGALAQTDWRQIEERSDRGRLLAKLIGSLPDEERAAMADSIPTYGVIRLKHHIRDALNALSRSARQVPGLSSSKNQLVMRTASLYISYVNCVHLSQEGISRHQIVNAQMDLSGFTSFFDVICKHLGAYVDWEQNQEAPGNNSTPHKKRKKEVKESRHTKLNHQNAQERVLNQEKQKEKLQKTWENMGISNDDPKHQVVSFGDPVIYLDSHNGARVKPHQLRGIQFLWRELIVDENQQGCLLAHTMGLGKTMQVYVP